MYRRRIKRFIDLFLTLLTMILWGPLLAMVAGLVRVRLGSPVLFRQVRPGLAAQPFTILKFRTMTDVRGSRGELLPDGDRLTPFGLWLRSMSLDELPELVNVLKGDMSLVGPRPLLEIYLPRYSREQARRHDVRPGITGWAQVNGRNAVAWSQRLQHDVWYVDHVSFWLDLKVLMLTFWRVLCRQGISAPGHSTMPGFSGIEETSLDDGDTSSRSNAQSGREQP